MQASALIELGRRYTASLADADHRYVAGELSMKEFMFATKQLFKDFKYQSRKLR